MALVGTVGRLARFPVKSMAGEEPLSLRLGIRGAEHDREWAVYTEDGGIASGKTTRRFRRVEGLMHWTATTRPGEVPLVQDPDGGPRAVDDPALASALSATFGRPLTVARETTVQHHDDSPLHLLTSSSLRAVERALGAPLDPRRLRANLLLETDGDGWIEDDWIDRHLVVGEAVLRITAPMTRCVMTDRSQSQVTPEPPLLAALGRMHAARLGAQAEVVRGGEVNLGDVVRLL